ncbi:MAG TPA: MIP family channel protein [Opitutaceae bacterium]|nr:MIP family channel protein [Opitutaceae bacterium]
MKPPPWFVGEFCGTFLLVFFGCGSVAAAVLTGAQVGIFQVAIVWGLGIATAIYLTGGLSGAHLNPAVTCALATSGRFPARRVGAYVTAQFAGAFAAAAVLQAVFAGPLAAYEQARGIVRGMPGSEATAMIFGEFFPNPGGRPLTEALRTLVTPATAFFIEALGTALLVLVILGVTDERNPTRPRELTAVTIGLTITLLISLLAPLTQAGFNPARDLAPRIWSALAGWGSLPFTANGWGWLTVYVLAPLFGGQVGGFLYRWLFKPAYGSSS